MPIYEYRCPVCAHVIERIEPANYRGAVPVCLECGADMPRIPFSVPGNPHLVGPGFYKNDYKEKP